MKNAQEIKDFIQAAAKTAQENGVILETEEQQRAWFAANKRKIAYALLAQK